MPTWLRGKSVLLKVDVSSTFTLLSGEIACRIEKTAPLISAANKNVSGHQGADYGDGRQTRIVGSGHLDTSALDAALDALEDAHDAQSKVNVEYIVPNPYNTYQGSVCVESFNIDGSNGDYAKVDFVLQFDGAPTKSATT